MLAAAPDMHITIEDFVAEDDGVVVRWTFPGTPAGEQDTTPSSDRSPVTAVAISIYRLADGLIVEDWDIDAVWPNSKAWQ